MLRGQSWSIAKASKECGFAIDSGKKMELLKKTANENRGGWARSDPADFPLHPDNWMPATNEALADPTGFLFVQRFFGFELSVWQQKFWAELEEAWATEDREYLCVNVAPGLGKALALDTPIATPGGWSTIKDLTVGDEVFDDQGSPCRVVAKSDVFYGHDCFEVTTDDGASLIADAAHEWPVRVSARYTPKPGPTGPKVTPDGVHLRETRDLARPRSKRPCLAMGGALDLPHQDLPIDPYVLGTWLGDGTSASSSITTADVEITVEITRAGYDVRRLTPKYRWGIGGLFRQLRLAGLHGNKHIPEAYFRASRAQRLALVQGLVDTDGYVSPEGCIEFCSTNRRLADGMQQLVRSLGAKASLREGRASVNGKDCGPKYRVGFYLADAARLPRKAVLCRDNERTPSRYLTATPVESVPTQCLQVDSPSRLFLAGEGMLVTHNSTVIVAFAAKRTALNRKIRGLFMSRAHSLAQRNTMRLRRALERTEPFTNATSTMAMDFGRFRARQGETWRAAEFVVEQPEGGLIEEKEPTWAAFGFDAEWLGNRLDLVFGDDLDSTRSIRNMEIVEQNWDIFDNELEPRLDPGGLLCITQQRLGSFDFSAHALGKKLLPEDDGITEDPDGALQYRQIIYKAHYEDKCLGVDTHKAGSPSWPDGCLLDPRRLPYRDLRKVMKPGNERTFQVVYQQNDMAAEDALVQRIWVDGGRDADGNYYIGCWDKDRDEWELPRRADGTLALDGDVLGIITVDPSPTKYWSVQAWAYHPDSKQQFLLQQHRERMEAPDFLDWAHSLRAFTGLAEDWWHLYEKIGVRLTHIIVEINAAQRFLLQYEHVHRWMRQRQVEVVAHSTQRNKSDPDYGIQMLAPVWKFGQVRLPGKGRGRISSMRLVDEAVRYPNSVTTDCLMGQWFLNFSIDRLYTPGIDMATPKWRPSWMQRVNT